MLRRRGVWGSLVTATGPSRLSSIALSASVFLLWSTVVSCPSVVCLQGPTPTLTLQPVSWGLNHRVSAWCSPLWPSSLSPGCSVILHRLFLTWPNQLFLHILAPSHQKKVLVFRKLLSSLNLALKTTATLSSLKTNPNNVSSVLDAGTVLSLEGINTSVLMCERLQVSAQKGLRRHQCH